MTNAAPLSSWTITAHQLAKVIDHALLKPDLTREDIIAGCALAKRYAVASVCVKPCYVALATVELQCSDVKVSTVIGFPLGASRSAVKMMEAQYAMIDGAEELDVVQNIGELRSGNLNEVEIEIKAITEAAHSRGVHVKVILETAYLSKEQKIRSCQIADRAGADWVTNSTGFAPRGAVLDDLYLMRSHISARVQVKAGGGMHNLDTLLAYVDTGVTRCCTTATAAILDEFQLRSNGQI